MNLLQRIDGKPFAAYASSLQSLSTKIVGFLYPMFRQDGHRTQKNFGLREIPTRKTFNYPDPRLVLNLMKNGEDQIYLRIR